MGRFIYTLMMSLVFAGLADCEGPYDIDNRINNLGGQDMSSQVMDRLTSLLDKLSSVEQRFDGFDQRLTSLDDRVTALDQRMMNHMGALRDQVDMLISQSNNAAGKVLQDLRSVCSELDGVLGNASSSGSGGIQPVDKKVSFKLKRVTKRETHDSYLVTLEYEASSKPTVIFSKAAGLPPIPVKEHEMNSVDIEVPKDPDADHPFVIFFLADDRFTAKLKLNGTPNVMDVSDIHINISPGRDIVFQPGEPVKVNFTLDVDGDVDQVAWQNMDAKILIQSESRDNVVNGFNSAFHSFHPDYFTPVHLQMTDVGGSKGHRYGTALLNSSIGDVEGILEATFTTSYNCSRNCLLETVNSAHSMRFYSEGHDSPFPKDYIGVVHEDYRSPDFSQFYCDIKTKGCAIFCDVVGDPGFSVSIEGMQSAKKGYSIAGNYMASAVLVFPNVTFADSGDYLCTARSGTREIREVLHLQVIEAAVIDKTLSAVTTYDNGSVSAVCVAKGNPAPNVTFDLDLDPHSYDVRTSHPEDTVTVTEIFISDPEANSPFHYYSCTATSVPSESWLFSNLHDFYMMGGDYNFNYTEF